MENEIPSVALQAVLKKSSSSKNKECVKGYDFNDGLDYDALLQSYKYSGFQATSLGLAVEEVNKMIACRHQSMEVNCVDSLEKDEFIQPRTNCTIFLGYTSNMVSAGLRETIRFLVEHKMVDCLVTSAGGIEEDIIKCLGPTILGDFALKGSTLRLFAVRNMGECNRWVSEFGDKTNTKFNVRKSHPCGKKIICSEQGLNRIGNLLVPNDNYCLFEDWVMPVLDELLEEQKSKNIIWSPSKIITKLGEKINNPDSICYWAAKNSIPIFSPALTDGSLGDMIYFHSYRNPGLVVDIAQDIRRINSIAVKAKNSGMIILGGGVVKHHTCNSNLMRNGADYAVYINTGNEFDGSDSGARPDEAVSWGKIKMTATPVKVYCDATLVFPLLVAQTFASDFHKRKLST